MFSACGQDLQIPDDLGSLPDPHPGLEAHPPGYPDLSLFENMRIRFAEIRPHGSLFERSSPMRDNNQLYKDLIPSANPNTIHMASSQTPTASPLSDHMLEWKNLSLHAPNSDKIILYPQSGSLRSGEVLAIMGPSGAGKTSFLDVISQRVLSSDPDASITFDGHRFSMRDFGSYVAQGNAHHGFLTVKDDIRYSALLSTYFERGVSGGQKRRVTIASSVITQPRILLCDEPMSGLDSTTGYQVATASLTGGHCVYQGPIDGVVLYCAKIGYPCPPHVNLADHVINIINTEFDVAETGVPNHERIQLGEVWIAHTSNLNPLGSDLDKRSSVGITSTSPGTTLGGVNTAFEPEQIRTRKSWNYRIVAEVRTWILTQRTALIIRRNVMLTGLRLFMYGAWVMGLMPISIGLKILERKRGYECTAGDSVVTYGKDGARVNDRISCDKGRSRVNVAAVPLYSEERPVFIREYADQVRPVCFPVSPSFSIPRRNNGLYGAGVYTIANTVVFIPYLFVCAMLYSCIRIYAAEAQHFLFPTALLVAAVIPDFIGALASVGLLTGFWTCIQGFLTLGLSLLVQNNFEGETFTCATLADGSCHCSVPGSLIAKGQCAVTGADILKVGGHFTQH
ncbi:hypothetical protein BS47DRAFT_1359591 [Hydnum rufescens UP504]|uniref:ABC transporter domain-containing protein n=1 Tax=Hydnum rufescens UP504 TaxID=1448309 RepID=A0A9P6DWK5_9AGAM|nr:hypothetical protein BS47DRAFT_1359591 [Hydnum rufescens UP504]